MLRPQMTDLGIEPSTILFQRLSYHMAEGCFQTVLLPLTVNDFSNAKSSVILTDENRATTMKCLGAWHSLLCPLFPFPVPASSGSASLPFQALPFLSSSFLLTPSSLAFVYPIVFLALPPSPPTTLNGPPGSPFLSELYLKVSFSGKPSLGTQLELQTPPLFECPVPFALLPFPSVFCTPNLYVFYGLILPGVPLPVEVELHLLCSLLLFQHQGQRQHIVGAWFMFANESLLDILEACRQFKILLSPSLLHKCH